MRYTRAIPFLIAFLLSAPAYAQNFDLQALQRGFVFSGKMLSIQETAEEAKQCIRQFLSQEEMLAYTKQVNNALPRVRALCDMGMVAQARAIGQSFLKDPKVRLATKTCDVYRMQLAEQLAGAMGYAPPEMSSGLYRMVRDLQRTPDNPCP